MATPDRLHVCFLANEYPPLRAGGIGTSTRNLARGLAAEGHRVTVIGWGAGERFDDGGVAVSFFAATPLPKMGWLLNRRRALREINGLVTSEQLSVVEAADWCGMSAGIHPRCARVVRCHGSATYFAHLEGLPVRTTVRWAESRALREADDVAAVSRFAGEKTREIFGLDRPVRCIPNGVDLSWFRPRDGAEPTGGPVLYFGALVRKKGVLDLPAIFEGVLSEVPAARFAVAGRDAPDRRTDSGSTWEMCRLRLGAGTAARLTELGSQPYEAMRDLIQAAAVCVFPSYAEALPMAWLEAMACARPIVAYDIGWARELIESGRNGILVPAGDVAQFSAAVVGLLRNSDLAGDLGREARRTVERSFSVETVARATVDWYREVLERR